MRRRMPALLLALSCYATCVAAPGAQAAKVAPVPRDPLEVLLNRIEAFLQRGEANGVTLDSRDLQNPPEQIRLSVVPQLLAHCELYRAHPNTSTSHYADIVERADFLVSHIETITSGTASDGMLAYALFSAYQITGDRRYWTPAETIARSSLELKGFGLKLNWGLMAALALAKYYQLGGDPLALAKATEIVRGVAFSQNADGGLPHLCAGTRDVHYTGWMSMELIQLYSLLGDPLIPRMLIGTHSFMQGRVGTDGVTSYQDPPELGLTGNAYYGPANGCLGDYDTRGWVNELGYEAILFDRFGDTRYLQVMDRLLQLEDHGAFPDKWGYFPNPDDRIYPWATDPRSVIRTSVVFWSLAALYADRETMGPARLFDAKVAAVLSAVSADAGETVSTSGAPLGFPFSATGVFLGEAIPDTVPAGPAAAADDATERAGAAFAGPSGAAQESRPSLALIGPGPARGAAPIQFTLPERDQISLRIYDVAGRGVRELWSGAAGRGVHRVVWDGRDDTGCDARSGLYFVRLVTRERGMSARLLWLR